MTKDDVERLLSMLFKEHRIDADCLRQEHPEGYLNTISPICQISRSIDRWANEAITLDDLAGFVETKGGATDNGAWLCQKAREVLLDPGSCPLEAIRSRSDGVLLRWTGDSAPEAYTKSILEAPSWEPQYHTPDYRIIAEWVLSLTSTT